MAIGVPECAKLFEFLLANGQTIDHTETMRKELRLQYRTGFVVIAANEAVHHGIVDRGSGRGELLEITDVDFRRDLEHSADRRGKIS